MTSVLGDLASAALLGTDRRPPQVPSAAGALGRALASQPWVDDAPGALLRAAALATTHARAGVRAAVFTDDLPVAAPGESAVPCSAPATTLLRRILADPELSDLLGDWLERVAARGELAPAILLPTLLDRGRARRSLQPPIVAAGGRRLAWLAAQNEDWAWAVPVAAAPSEVHAEEATSAAGVGTADTSLWHTGSRVARTTLLAALRETDPAAARALVESTWKQDPPEQRAGFLAVLRQGLASDDEPLLEQALADRRKEVRDAAAELLTALIGSAFRKRMGARLTPLVSVEGRVRKRLAVELPPLPDAAAKRDGLLGRQRDGLGPRAVTLAEIVAGAGLDRWTGELTGATTPDEVLSLARGTDNEAALRSGWRTAALRERHPQWSVVMAIQDRDPQLLIGLPPRVVAPAVAQLLTGANGYVAEAVLPSLPGPWSVDLSKAVVQWLVRVSQYPDRPTLRHIAASLHPSVVPDAIRRFTRLREQASGPADTLLHVLDLHQAIRRELPTP